MSARLASVCSATPPLLFCWRAVCFECRWAGKDWIGREAAITEIERHNERSHTRGLAA
jgi:hypothetical protein